MIVYGHGGSMGYGAAGGVSLVHPVHVIPQYSLERSEELRKSNERWARLEREKAELRGPDHEGNHGRLDIWVRQ